MRPRLQNFLPRGSLEQGICVEAYIADSGTVNTDHEVIHK